MYQMHYLTNLVLQNQVLTSVVPQNLVPQTSQQPIIKNLVVSSKSSTSKM